MKLSLQATVVIGIVFAIASLGVAITGFASLSDIADPDRLADAKGFAWFWTFLACVALAFAALAAWMSRGNRKSEDP